MPSRSIWSHGSGTALQDLLASCCGSLLLRSDTNRPVYFSSPWMSDFVLFGNTFGEYGALFPESPSRPQYKFSDFLVRLAMLQEVRIVTVRGGKSYEVSEKFAETLRMTGVANLSVRFAEQTYHEKGILAPTFYIEGSMNLTYMGTNVRDEKVIYHSEFGNEDYLASAYLNFDRLWNRSET